MNGSFSAGKVIDPAETETPSMTITRQLNELSEALDRIEKSSVQICGGGTYGEAKVANLSPVPNGLHANWRETVSSLSSKASRIAETLSTI